MYTHAYIHIHMKECACILIAFNLTKPWFSEKEEDVIFGKPFITPRMGFCGKRQIARKGKLRYAKEEMLEDDRD